MTTPNFTDIEFLQLTIQSGVLDADLETILRSVRMRQDLIARLNVATMVEGDYVRVKGDVRPRYIENTYMRIVKFEGDRVHCRLLSLTSRSPVGTTWRMTMNSIQKVEAASLPEYIKRAEGLI